MMDEKEYEEHYEERVLPILRGRKECRERYSSITEFKKHLNDATLAEEKLDGGWVMWRENERYEQQQQLHHKIKTLLKHIASDFRFRYDSLVQYWGVVKEEGRHHYLSTSNYPFYFDNNLSKGVSWYRKSCVDSEAAEAEQLGGVGRAYRNKQAESTPDLRLYSISEFPLRNEAASCGFRGYMALPLFDLHTQQCYGVLEFLSDSSLMQIHGLCSMEQGLQIAGLRSTNTSCFRGTDLLARYEQPESEITEILALAIKAEPRLSLAQVWIPCEQCLCTNLCCMQMASFISAENKKVSSNSYIEIYDQFGYNFDCDMNNYLKACAFHNLKVDLRCLLRNMSDLSISQSPLAHHAKKARLSHCFAVCLESMNISDDPFVIIHFFLQLKYREDACGDSSLHLLLRIIEMKLKRFKLVSIEQLPHELVVQSRQPNIAIECESIDMLNVMNSDMENFSELDFTTSLETSCSLQTSSKKADDGGWVFCSLDGENSIDNDVQGNLLNVPSLTKYKIEQFMKKIVVKSCGEYWIIQFWMPKKVDDRYRLETIDQPYALSSLAKGLASFRKECMKHHYFVDEKANEEELGPPGRVFKNEHPEFSPSLFLYSTKELRMRYYAMHCHLEKYFALPVFDNQEHKCVGVLEFMGISYDECCAKDIDESLKEANLSTSCLDMRPKRRDDDIPADIAQSLTEIKAAFNLIRQIPQLYLAKVWVPYEKCASINSNVRYMELALTTEYWWEGSYTNQVHWISRVQSNKGMIGMVLESENKSCFCQSLSEFSIADQPLALVERDERLDVCFAICLQSSHTGDLLYVLEFFLYQGPATCEYLRPFLNYLLPVMKQELKTFKMASGKQLGDELVIEVIEFSKASTLTFPESDQPYVFPIKFKSVCYGKKEHQHIEDQQVQTHPKVKRRKHCKNVSSNIKKKEKGKKKTTLNLRLEDVKAHFGKKMNDAADELGVSRSSIKRLLRKHGIGRWPYTKNQARNPFLFENNSPYQDMPPSSSRSLQLQDVPPTTNTESTQHQRLYSHDTSKEKKGSFPAKLHLLKKDEYDDDNDDIVQIIDDNNALLGKVVALTTDSTNAIVAYGTVVGQNKKSNLLHGHPFPKDCTCVSIDKVVNADASLPIPIPNECNNVGDAVGTQVAWPNLFVLALNKGPLEKNNVQKVAKERMVKGYASLPGPLKMVCSYAKHDLNDGTGILIVVDNDVFGYNYSIYVHLEDIIPFCELEPISGNCIVVYIWHLYNKIKQENTIGRFQFMNPFTISYVSNVQSPIDRAIALANRLIAVSQNQLVLVPCNIGEHWILTVIQPYEEVVSYLDPLYHCICDKWEHVVYIAMSMFNANLKKSIIKQPTWRIIEVPRQPDLKQCGYYVMCYMKAIVQGLITIDSSSLSSLFVREEYSVTNINEVRVEWAHCLQEHA